MPLPIWPPGSTSSGIPATGTTVKRWVDGSTGAPSLSMVLRTRCTTDSVFEWWPWVNGVPIAQEAHENILKRFDCLDHEETLRFGQSFPLSKVIQGAYVDDLLIAGKVPIARAPCLPGHDASCPLCSSDAGVMPDVQRFRTALPAYEAAGAETSTEKAIDFSETFTAWGTEVKGREGRVAVCSDKRRQVFRLLFAVLLSGHVSKHSLQSLLGSII